MENKVYESMDIKQLFAENIEMIYRVPLTLLTYMRIMDESCDKEIDAIKKNNPDRDPEVFDLVAKIFKTMDIKTSGFVRDMIFDLVIMREKGDKQALIKNLKNWEHWQFLEETETTDIMPPLEEMIKMIKACPLKNSWDIDEATLDKRKKQNGK